MDAADIDTRVYVTSEAPLRPGDFAWVRITGSREYDLVGEAETRGEAL